MRNYRIFFKMSEPKSQLIENVKLIEIVFDTLYITTEHDVMEFGLSSIVRFICVKSEG